MSLASLALLKSRRLNLDKLQQKQKALSIEQEMFIPTYRKIAHSGNARYIAITRQIPLDWKLVETTVQSCKDGLCILKIRKID